jgi:hypothetical protein
VLLASARSDVERKSPACQVVVRFDSKRQILDRQTRRSPAIGQSGERGMQLASSRAHNEIFTGGVSTGNRKSDPHSGHISLGRLVSHAWHSDQPRTV